VRGVAQVARDVGRRRDADEHRRAGVDLEADLAVVVAVEHGVEAVEIEIEVLGGERVAVGREAFRVRGEVALLVLLGVAPQEDAAGREQAEREKGGY